MGNGTWGGGGLSWRNNIPVTPGETLTISFTATATNSGSLGSTQLLRDTTVLCLAYSGGHAASSTPSTAPGGRGGKTANAINDGGGNGGSGLRTADGRQAGGGAGGYLGNGGSYSLTTTSTAAVDGSGGAGGARVLAANTSRTGGNVGLHGIGDTGGNNTTSLSLNGRDGSVSDTMCGGGLLSTSASFNGGIRIIWGEGYSYPYNADKNIVPLMTNNNTTLGYTATASSFYASSSNDYSPYKAFSRDLSETNYGWVSAVASGSGTTMNEWLKIELPEAVVVRRYAIIGRIFGPASYELQGSVDGSVWVTLHAVTDRPASDDTILKEYTITNTTAYGYYRIHITKVRYNSYASIKILNLYRE